MLVLERKPDKGDHSEILIGEGEDIIRLKVIAIRQGGIVRLGIDAPKHIRILRREIAPQEDLQEGKRNKGTFGKSFT